MVDTNAPRSITEPLIGCVQHDCESCKTKDAELAVYRQAEMPEYPAVITGSLQPIGKPYDYPLVAQDSYDALRTYLAKVTVERGEGNRMLKIERIKNANSLANNLCPDHRDKQRGKPCLACSIESAERRLAKCERDAEQAYIELSLEGIRPDSVAHGIAELRRRLAECERDAARYRWLRSHANYVDRNGPGLYWYLSRRHKIAPNAEWLDMNIDAAIAKEQSHE
jgi:hypothetical protein